MLRLKTPTKNFAYDEKGQRHDIGDSGAIRSRLNNDIQAPFYIGRTQDETDEKEYEIFLFINQQKVYVKLVDLISRVAREDDKYDEVYQGDWYWGSGRFGPKDPFYFYNLDGDPVSLPGSFKANSSEGIFAQFWKYIRGLYSFPHSSSVHVDKLSAEIFEGSKAARSSEQGWTVFSRFWDAHIDSNIDFYFRSKLDNTVVKEILTGALTRVLFKPNIHIIQNRESEGYFLVSKMENGGFTEVQPPQKMLFLLNQNYEVVSEHPLGLYSLIARSEHLKQLDSEQLARPRRRTELSIKDLEAKVNMKGIFKESNISAPSFKSDGSQTYTKTVITMNSLDLAANNNIRKPSQISVMGGSATTVSFV
jgi:hypothetical protein